MTHVRITVPGPNRSGKLLIDGHDIANAVTSFTITWPDDDQPPRARLQLDLNVDDLEVEADDVLIDDDEATT